MTPQVACCHRFEHMFVLLFTMQPVGNGSPQGLFVCRAVSESVDNLRATAEGHRSLEIVRSRYGR